jgi:phospholipid/cholesterol/gamma-HCH transport system substrate-binding protein
VRRASIVALFAVVGIVGASCTGVNDDRTITAEFTRAVQVFPGAKVTVLGVDVGQVTDVETGTESVTVTMRINDPEVAIPADAGATIVPMSLLGERYVQLFPAYTSGAKLEDGATIPMARTNVPAEGDELLQAMQDYFGELDATTLEEFVSNAATLLEGRGRSVNRLIEKGTRVVSTLDSRRDEVANMIVQFDRLTSALATRQDALARLINTYNVVGTTINDVRSSLEGTITGLNDASAALAGLLIDHRDALGADIKALTRTTRTLDRNVERVAQTGHWARRLFDTARRAIDFERDWLRLGNQAGPLPDLILHRVEDRLVGVCLRLDQPGCSAASYWEKRFPELFCTSSPDCARPARADPRRSAGEALAALPEEIQDVVDDAADKNCKKAKHPKRCRAKKKSASEAQNENDSDGLGDLIDDIIEGLPDLPPLPGGGLP